MPEEENNAKIFLHEVAIGARSTLELKDFLREAWKYNQRSATSGKWRSRMWTFVRLAKGHPVLQDLSAADALAVVHAVIDEWERPDAKTDAWVHWFPGDDPRMEFWDGWEKVNTPIGAGELAAALAKAQRSPFHPTTTPSSGYDLFVSLSAWLQIAAGQGQIFLPCEKIGFALGMSARTISAYRRVAILAGLLDLRQKGRYSEHRADEFYFHIELFDERTRRQLGGQPSDFNQEGQEQHEPQEKQEVQEFQEQQESQDGQDLQSAKEVQGFADSQREMEVQRSSDCPDFSGTSKERHEAKAMQVPPITFFPEVPLEPSAMQERRSLLARQVKALHHRTGKVQNGVTPPKGRSENETSNSTEVI